MHDDDLRGEVTEVKNLLTAFIARAEAQMAEQSAAIRVVQQGTASLRARPIPTPVLQSKLLFYTLAALCFALAAALPDGAPKTGLLMLAAGLSAINITGPGQISVKQLEQMMGKEQGP